MKSNNWLIKIGYVGGGVFIVLISVVLGAFFVVLLPVYTVSWLNRKYKKTIVKNVQYKQTLLTDKTILNAKKITKFKTKLNKFELKQEKYKDNEKKLKRINKQIIKFKLKLDKIKDNQEAITMATEQIINELKSQKDQQDADNSFYTKTNTLIKSIHDL